MSNKELKPIMFVGTGSDVGKSVLNAGFCRIFQQDGFKPAPFKAQNMSLNSFATEDGFEIGRAQAMQAEACKTPPLVQMNPVLLKPTSEQKAQVVVNGKPVGTQTAKEYFEDTDREKLFLEAMKSLNFLCDRFSPVVLEGAGSISEMNLWDKDITNMRVAEYKSIPTYLIADIDKGGVIASVYGSILLLPDNQRALIQGIILNKFRGDISLFEEGKRIIEELTGIPVVGVVPYFRDIYLEQEDSVVVDRKKRSFVSGKINVAVCLIPHMSNFTDFDVLEILNEVNLYYSDKAKEVEKADIIFIPGSKNTIADLKYLKSKGLDCLIRELVSSGKQVYGICGGFQMLGEKIFDEYGVESSEKEIDGIGVLPIKTYLEKEKKTVQVEFKYKDSFQICKGYEIHMGVTKGIEENTLCVLDNEQKDGCFKNENVWGTYIHGILDNACVLNDILSKVNPNFKTEINYFEYKSAELDKLAKVIREHCNMEYIYHSLK